MSESIKTKLVNLGRDPDSWQGMVNLPLSRCSTILYPSMESYEKRARGEEIGLRYARMGNPLSNAFEKAMAELENGFGAWSFASGLMAITGTIMAFAKAGDHVLICGNAYAPVLDFAENQLGRFGIEVEFFDPHVGADIAGIIRDNTALIHMESPGSATFDVMDVPAIASVAKNKNVLTMIDNTWSTPLLFNPIEHGVDIVIHSGTKYIVGHADVTLGVAICRTEELYTRMKSYVWDSGLSSSPDDLYMALRGLRTMEIRLKQTAENTLKVAQFLETRPEIARVFYPALESHPDHDLWKRDYRGANSILSILLQPHYTRDQVYRCVNTWEHFPVGSSWGGYESLCQPQYLKTARKLPVWEEEGQLLRLQIGLEDADDLIVDLTRGLETLK